MKALCWHGKSDVRIDNVPDPKIMDPRDVIVKITSSGICGSDLHLLNGYMPTMKKGDILGHEPMGKKEPLRASEAPPCRQALTPPGRSATPGWQ